MDLKVSSTIGYERRHNELLGVADEDEFVARATAGLRPQPPNFKSIVAINRGPLERRPLDAEPLTPRQVEQSDAPVIDIRTALQFDEAHIPGAISNTVLQAGFGTRLAWIAGPDQRGRARRAATTPTRCARSSSPRRSASGGSRATSRAG